MTNISPSHEEHLYTRVVGILEDARSRVTRTVNTAMVYSYWLIGREIVQVEQQGKKRAEYGEQLMRRLAVRLASRFGRGFSVPTLRNMRQFYLVYPLGTALPEDLTESDNPLESQGIYRTLPIRSAVLSESVPHAWRPFPAALGWTHYLRLMRIPDPVARGFYEIEAVREGWSSRELERQLASHLFERLAKSRDKDLEQAIIERLGDFLLELGKGFCFVARQKRLTLEGDHFYVDLVFYNRLLRCFVLLDLKLGKLTHQDLGQMQMYVNWFDRFQRTEHEAGTIGIVLCSEKNEAMVKITLPEHSEKIRAARYQLYLPTEEELRARLAREREQAERAVQLVREAKENEPR
jgi:predicted nuclease of restriction endonuclease-like (RecB) superfamily